MSEEPSIPAPLFVRAETYDQHIATCLWRHFSEKVIDNLRGRTIRIAHWFAGTNAIWWNIKCVENALNQQFNLGVSFVMV